MFAPISAIFALLFFASTLPNGIRLVELSSQEDSVEIVAGYTSGALTGFFSSAAVRAFLADAYAVGARVEFIDEEDRTGLRVTLPKWAAPMLVDRLPAIFNPVTDSKAPPAISELDFKASVEEEVRNALLGPAAREGEYATADAFVLISAPAPTSLRERLAAISNRPRAAASGRSINRLTAERTLRFKSELPEGGVIFASPVAGVHYRQWYSMLLLDRLIRRVVPLRLSTTLPLTVRPHYYRLELSLPAGQFPEPAEENLLQELQRLQFTPANAKIFEAARIDAAGYLDSKPVREWFASHDILGQLAEGMLWIQGMSTEDMRVTARDVLIMNRVVASWAPKPRQTSVSSERLGDSAPSKNGAPSAAGPLPDRAGETGTGKPGYEISFSQFPSHDDARASTPSPEKLSSGVSVVAGNFDAVFVSGEGFTRFDRAPAADDLKAFQRYRADRVLVVSPASSMDRVRQLWSTFKGSANDETAASKSRVSIDHLPALFVLKTILDLKLIEAGWSRDVSIRIDAGESSGLGIQASIEKRVRILEWTRVLAAAPLTESDFIRLREVAIHHLDEARAELQTFIWELDPQATLPDLETVSAKRVQDVARSYF